jgi:electron transport complex protein RnfG
VKSQLRSIIKPAIVLLIICLVVTASLAFTYAITRDKIEERAKLDAENARREVLADANYFNRVENIERFIDKNPELNIVKEVYEGVKDNASVGYAFMVVNKGYGGDMNVTVGINNKGEITGVKIGNNSETPGLGLKVTDEAFRSQFVGFAPSEPLQVVKGEKAKQEEIEAISSATISTRAVTKAVQAAVDMASQLLEEGGKAE